MKKKRKKIGYWSQIYRKAEMGPSYGAETVGLNYTIRHKGINSGLTRKHLPHFLVESMGMGS